MSLSKWRHGNQLSCHFDRHAHCFNATRREATLRDRPCRVRLIARVVNLVALPPPRDLSLST